MKKSSTGERDVAAVQTMALPIGCAWSSRVARPAGELAVAFCAAETGEVAFGVGQELALARAADKDVAPKWVQIFPAGPEIVARDGRKWTLEDPQVLVDAFAGNGADLPFDLEHATEIKAPKGEAAPAQGWIKELQARDDKTVWARVEWNDAGRAAIAGKSYRYVSPAFRHTKDTRAILAVTSVALVTQPALHIPALARSEGGNLEDKETMSKLTLVALASAAGLATTAGEDDVLSAITANAQAAKDIKDPSKFVPKADLDQALARATKAEGDLAAIKKADDDKAAVELVDQAVADGKLAPASKDHYVAIARENFEGVKTAIASMPKGLVPTDTNKKPEGEGGAGKDEHGLDETQLSVCHQLGVEPKDFAKTLKEQG